MNLSDKELRKMMNAAWDDCYYRSYTFGHKRSPMSAYWVRRRHQDVTKIIAEAKKEENDGK